VGDTDFKRLDGELSKSRGEIADLQERIKRLIQKRGKQPPSGPKAAQKSSQPPPKT